MLHHLSTAFLNHHIAFEVVQPVASSIHHFTISEAFLFLDESL